MSEVYDAVTGERRPASKAAERRAAAPARRRDRRLQEAYEAGRSGRDATPYNEDLAALDAWQAGADEAAAGANRRDASRPAGRSGAPGGPGGAQTHPALAGALEVTHQSGSLLLGMVTYAVVVNYLRGGTNYVHAWFDAKFMNQPWSPAGRAPAPPPPLAPGHHYEAPGPIGQPPPGTKTA